MELTNHDAGAPTPAEIVSDDNRGKWSLTFVADATVTKAADVLKDKKES